MAGGREAVQGLPRRARPGAGLGLAGAISDTLDPHMRQACLAKAERARGGGRDIDDATANERPPIDDFENGATAVVEIDHPHSRPKRKGFVSCNQTGEMWI